MESTVAKGPLTYQFFPLIASYRSACGRAGRFFLLILMRVGREKKYWFLCYLKKSIFFIYIYRIYKCLFNFFIDLLTCAIQTIMLIQKSKKEKKQKIKTKNSFISLYWRKNTIMRIQPAPPEHRPNMLVVSGASILIPMYDRTFLRLQSIKLHVDEVRKQTF